MKKNDRKAEIDAVLAGMAPKQAMRSREEFWEDFRARARMTMQEAPLPQQSWVASVWFKPALGMALVLAAAAGFFLLPDGARAQETQIKSLEVVAFHRAVFIMKDDEQGGTVAWITELERKDRDS